MNSEKAYSRKDSGSRDQYHSSGRNHVWVISVYQPLDDRRVDQLDVQDNRTDS